MAAALAASWCECNIGCFRPVDDAGEVSSVSGNVDVDKLLLEDCNPGARLPAFENSETTDSCEAELFSPWLSSSGPAWFIAACWGGVICA